jgi:cell division protein FtsB
MSSRVDQHEEDIKEVKGKTDKLVNDSAVTSTKLQKLDSQVDKLEDKVFEQAQARTKK